VPGDCYSLESRLAWGLLRFAAAPFLWDWECPGNPRGILGQHCFRTKGAQLSAGQRHFARPRFSSVFPFRWGLSPTFPGFFALERPFAHKKRLQSPVFSCMIESRNFRTDTEVFHMDSNNTITFSMEEVREADMKRILITVYDALKEKGYNPISQIVGYILSEDPTYITTHNNARSLIRRIDRDELLKAMVRSYLGE